MAQNQKNERLDDRLLDCNLTLFGRPDLDGFSKAGDIKNYIEKDSLVYFSGCKVLSKNTFVIDVDFYTVSNKYELKSKLNGIVNKYSLGVSYRIRNVEE